MACCPFILCSIHAKRCSHLGECSEWALRLQSQLVSPIFSMGLFDIDCSFSMFCSIVDTALQTILSWAIWDLLGMQLNYWVAIDPTSPRLLTVNPFLSPSPSSIAMPRKWYHPLLRCGTTKQPRTVSHGSIITASPESCSSCQCDWCTKKGLKRR